MIKQKKNAICNPSEDMKTSCIKSQKHARSLASKKLASETGTQKEKSKASAHQGICDCSTSQTSLCLCQPQTVKSSSTPESHPRNKKKTSDDNNNSFKRITLSNIPDQNMTSSKSQTSDLESTSRGRDFYEFWDSSKKETYQRLSWLQETELPALDSNSSNGSVTNTELKSWFSTLRIQPQSPSSEMTSWQSCKFTVADGTDEDDTRKQKKPEEMITKALKLRLRPTPTQKVILNQWAGSSRFLFNKTTALLSNPKNKCLKSKYSLRNRFAVVKSRKTKHKNSFYYDKKWLEDCPNSIRAGAVFDAKANMSACFSNLRAKNIQYFTTPFKTKRKEEINGWSMSIEKQNIQRKEKALFLFETKLGVMRYYSSKQLIKLMPGNKPEMDCKIQKSAFGEYFLVIPRACKVKISNASKEYANPVAVDPGLRKFLTTYAPNDRESFMMGNRWATTIMNKLVLLDNLYSMRAKGDRSKAIQIKRLRKDVFYLKKELRDQCSNFLTKRYDVVLMPKLETGKLCIKANRRLTTKTARSLLQAGHCQFFNSLKMKCLERGVRFLEVKEHYTSQTCPCCGCLNKCNEVYVCTSCSFKHDRDVVGALNIFLKAVRS